MTQHYRLPLEAIVEAMKYMPEVVSLQATLSIPSISKEPCLAEVILGQGKMHSCVIASQTTGFILRKENEAYTLLQQSGDLVWSVHSTTYSTSLLPLQERGVPTQMSPPNEVRYLPMRSTPSLSAVQIRTLANTHKRVFALADGTHTIEQIARLLSKPLPEIRRTLQDLQKMNLIKS